MEKIISILRKPAKWIVVGSVGAYALLEILYAIGRMANGGGEAVVGGLFFLICFGGLAAALLYSILTNKEKAARYIGCMLFAFLAIRLVYNLLSGDNFGTDISLASYSFDFIARISAMAILAIVILKLFMEKLEGNKVIDIVVYACLASFIFFSFLARILEIAAYADFEHQYEYYQMPWYLYVDIIAELLILPGYLFGYILLFTKDQPVEVKAEEEPAESKEEVPAEEEETKEDIEPAEEVEAEAEDIEETDGKD
ncbi:MAG: hypothetical protein J5656_03140 [Clostridia bacterium]|nr:hypothetical protein [Clostridia bacterium]